MHSQNNVSGYRALFIILVAMMAVSVAQFGEAQTGTQNTENSAQAAPTNVAKASQPSTPDIPTQNVPGVRPDSFIIGAEDVLSVNVWKEPEMSKVVPVRPDGMISLPLIGDVKAAGYTPLQLQDQLAATLKKLISQPSVTVMVTEVHSLSFNVVGEVMKPGFYPLTRRLTVLDAIALSGGFKDFAKSKKVYVLRTDASGKQERLPFNYKAFIKGQNSSQNIELQPRDTVVVP